MDHGKHDSAEEPQTPMWLPALGVVLFLGYGIWWATRPVPQPPPPAPAASASASASAAPAPAVSIAPPRQR